VRLCVLGNSHAASLKRGWSTLQAALPGVELTFFAARATAMSDLVAGEGALVPATAALRKAIAFTSGGSESVQVARFDAFLTYGLWLPMPLLDTRLSEAVRRQACHDVLLDSLNHSICLELRKLTRAPILVGHDPQFVRSSEPGLPASFLGYDEVFGMVQGNLRLEGARLLRQPAVTLEDGWHTRPEHAVGATRLDLGDIGPDAPQPQGDRIHMNGEFGALYLRHVIQQLQG
jgi:hypothetical protein